ncbi:MAG: choice-of-anchor Q domain-containing protein [Anaerolineae bacterium]
MNRKAVVSGIISVALFWFGLTIFAPVSASKPVALGVEHLNSSALAQSLNDQSAYDPSRQTVCRDGCDYESLSAAISATSPLTHAYFSILDSEVFDRLIRIDQGKKITIVGLGMERTKIGGPPAQATDPENSPIFIIEDGATVLLENLTVWGGTATNNDGGGLQVAGSGSELSLNYVKVSNNSGRSGGGIAVSDQANLIVKDSIIEKNQAVNEGGGIYVMGGLLELDRMLIAENSSTAGGGVFYASDQGKSSILNVTFTGNMATLMPNAVTANRGGGAFYITNLVNASQSSEIDFHFSTVSQNATADGEAGGMFVDGGTINVLASIFSENLAGDNLENCKLESGNLISHGYNLGSDQTCVLNESTDLILADLELSELADNGGGSKTFATGINSHAIGFVPVQHCPATDQRGISRTEDSACDIGAYEAEHYLTYCSAPLQSIPDNDPTGLISNLAINRSDEIYDLSLFLQVSNENNFIKDFEASLILDEASPTTIGLVSKPAINGSCNPFGPSMLDLRFNDAFSDQLTGSTCFIDSTLKADYKPLSSAASLNSLIGKSLDAATWQLKLVDSAAGSTGTLTNWCVQAKIKPDSLIVTRSDDPVPDGCQTGDCSLREAIIDADNYPGRDEITVDVAGPILLTQSGNGGNSTGDTPEKGDLDITDDLILIGNITDVITIDASGANDRVFDIVADVDVTISGFELTGGNVSTGPRGGGAILNRGTFVGDHLLIRKNSTVNEFGYGGAIQSTSGADFTLRNSEIISNSAQYETNGVRQGFYSGAYNWNSTMELSGVTIAGNDGVGSVVYNFAAGGDAVLQINSVTLARNSAMADTGIGTFYSSANANPEMALTYLHNSIVGSHSNKSCDVGTSSGNNSAAIVALGYNLAADDSCHLTVESGLPSTDPLLQPLAEGTGGSYVGRWVLLPSKLSPVHDNGDPEQCPGVDGRGASRPQHANCDIGAIELTTAEIPARIFLPLTGR